MNDIKLKATIQALIYQRNEAQNSVADLIGELAAANDKIEELTARVTELEVLARCGDLSLETPMAV